MEKNPGEIKRIVPPPPRDRVRLSDILGAEAMKERAEEAAEALVDRPALPKHVFMQRFRPIPSELSEEI